MKNKTKKILAGACLGLTGMACLTGCSIELTEAQKDKIMTVVESSDTFMNESIELLRESDAKLDKEKSLGLLNLALKRLELNVKDVMNNLRITVTTDWDATDGYYGKEFNVNYFKDSQDKYYFYTAKKDNSITDLIYSSGLNENVTVVKGNQFVVTQNYITNVNRFNFYFFSMGEIKLENILNYSTLENGNYEISYFTQTGSEKILNFVEMSKEGVFINAISEVLVDDGEDDYITTLNYSFEYGVLDENSVLEIVATNSK